MIPYVLTAPAQRDLERLAAYLQQSAGTATADYVLEEIGAAMTRVGNSPGLGHRRSDLTSKPAKFYSVWAYFVIYDDSNRPIRILRVIHGARNVPRLRIS